MRISLFTFLALFLLVQSSCKDQSEKDLESIIDYLTENNIEAEATSTGLYYTINAEGTGTRPLITDDVTVDYKGYLIDGSIFDSSYERGTPATFPLSQVIVGWQEGIPLFKEGGSGTLYIPSRLGYGSSSPSAAIPRNSVLIFDIELHEVN